MIALILAGALLSSPQDFAARADDLVRLNSAIEFCDRAGYRVVDGAAQTARAAYVSELSAAGLSAQRISGLEQDAERIEGRRLEMAFDFPDGLDNDQLRAVVQEKRAYVLAACQAAKQSNPEAFEESPDEGRFFMGHMGMWASFPLVEELQYYALARGYCAVFRPPFDPVGASEKFSRAFADQPEESLSAFRAEVVSRYREGLNDPDTLDQTQCSRLMPRAERDLATAWSAHFGGNPPFGPFDE